MKSKTVTAALLATFAGGAATAAFATSASKPQDAWDMQKSSVVVHYGPEDLSSNADAERLFLRLQRAAETVCGSDEAWDVLSVEQWRDIRTCERDAMGRAVDEVDSPRLTAEYDQHWEGAQNGKVASAEQMQPSPG
ncbi:MAG TPA: UrcA family protein [Gammaproteobacteria bacterium]|nr:UrcA family protein [Gammaproteobacteria bacterium]